MNYINWQIWYEKLLNQLNFKSFQVCTSKKSTYEYELMIVFLLIKNQFVNIKNVSYIVSTLNS